MNNSTTFALNMQIIKVNYLTELVNCAKIYLCLYYRLREEILMKKENYGMPAALLNVMIYVVGLYVCVSNLTLIWVLLGLTISVFALELSGSVKKTAVQASALVLMFVAINAVFGFFGTLLKFADSAYISFEEVRAIIIRIVDIGAYVIFAVLGIMALVKKDLFVDPVHKAVDGFVPRPVYQQPQQFAGQPQQFAGQPQQFAGQPQQFAGQPQQPNGQPQQPN